MGRAKTSDLKEFDETTLVVVAPPKIHDADLVHNDFKLDNMILDRDDPSSPLP
jgi:aminoglycoside phosphotransferase (APT) family kinase protein